MLVEGEVNTEVSADPQDVCDEDQTDNIPVLTDALKMLKTMCLSL